MTALATGPGWAFMSYLVATLVLAVPLVPHIGSSLPNDLGDPLPNTWILWHNTTGLPFTEDWWNPSFFYPSTNVLAYSEHLFGISLISTPVYWLTGSPTAAHNIAFLSTFPLSGLAAYMPCFELTRRRDTSWLAGLAFAFAPYRMDQLAHVQVLASYWMPLGLFALHRYYRDPRIPWLALFGICTLMNGLTNGYFLLFYPPLILMWVLWFTPNEGWWRKVAAVAAAGALAVLVLLPSLLTYQRVHEQTGLARSNDETLLFSADVSGLLERPDPIGRLELSRCRASPRRAAVSRADRRRADRGRLVPRDMVTAQTRTWRSPDHQAQRRFRERRVYWGDRRSRPHRAVAGATTWRIPPPRACRPHARP